MSPINKFEAIGIFASVAMFAIALSVLRFASDNESLSRAVSPGSQQGTVVIATDGERGLTIENALKDSVTTTGSLTKLIIDDIRVGSGREARLGDTVVLDYIGSTQDGIQFDNSYVRGEPFTFKIGSGQVIDGWERGITGMRAGGQRILVIPPELAYGNRQVGPIPPGSSLVFAIELLEIK